MIILLVFFVIGLSGCVTSSHRLSDAMDSWKGSHQSELIASSWGPPARTTPDGKGGTVLIYEKYQTVHTGDSRYSHYKKIIHVGTRMFYVNKDGIIYSWRWKNY